MKPGDWVYFWNIAEYHTKHPGGAWGGENAVYEGKNGLGQDIFSGFGASKMTEMQMNQELLKEYNAGLPAAEELTMAQWQAKTNEQGGRSGLDLSSVMRIKQSKVEDMLR